MLRNRVLASAVSTVLAVGLGAVPASAATVAGSGPSVGLPAEPSVPVTAQSMQERPADVASGRALRGDQPAGGAAGDGGGTPAATSLSPSATWDVSAHTGSFQWSYPLRVPPSPGGLEPSLALSYASSALDGRTSATNNQPSWVGDGWDLHPGFVERTYGGCADDKDGGTVPPKTGDLCWRSDNATASYNGGGGMLIRDAASGVWRPRDDDGSRVERDTGAGNGDDNGEYWKITTVEGVQYFYGSRPEARSTWTVPVYGDDAGEPCYDTSFAASRCTQAWRWNLDKVVDARGNLILYQYETETNAYGANLQDAAVSYVRGGWLQRIDYGLHTGVDATAAARVEFAVADRCLPGSTCVLDRTENWPDTPLTERCDTATCQDQHAPTFWTTKRLDSVTTRVWRGSAYSDVDRWTLEQLFPDPGDGDKAALWLRSITHTGLVGGNISLPAVTFEGAQMPNRVYQSDGLSPVIRYRVVGIVSEAGGVVSVNYAPAECVPGGAMPASPESNSLRCFPARWYRHGYGERTDWFHKYVVASVISSDRVNSSTDQQVSYEYLDGAAWAFDTSEFSAADKKTYNDFRGYARVRIRNGRAADPGVSPVTMVEKRFYRGMHGDRLPGGGTRTVAVTDSENGSRVDELWLAGFSLETTTFLGESAAVVAKSLTDPVWQGPTATRGEYKAYIVRPGTARTITPLEGGGRRTTRAETAYDDRGLPVRVNDLGDADTAADDLCTRTTYVRNTSTWLLSLASRVEKVSVHCGATPAFPDDAVSDERTSYDDQTHGVAPRIGNATRVERLESRPALGPVYTTVSEATYDVHGRAVETRDALGHRTRTAYTPATGGPVTKTVVTDPKSFTTTTRLEPAFGAPLTVTDANGNTTEISYDALGRAVKMWLPDRPRLLGMSPNQTLAYAVHRDAPTVVTTSSLGPNGRYTTSKVLYDGLLRTRQAQAPAVGGGRLLTDARYDSQGRVYKSTRTYFNDAPVDDTLWLASDTEIPGQTRTLYDGAGRPTASIVFGGAVEKWRTTTTYGGDRVHIDPPVGGIPSTTVIDARGRTVELHQHRGQAPSGPADVARYTYSPSDQLATLADPVGNTWRFTYDPRGRLIRSEDPDKGVNTNTFDWAGRLVSQVDARGQTLAHTYDELDRKLTTRAGSATGRLLAQWTYDTVRYGKGKPANATLYDAGGNAFTTAVLEYTARYQPRRSSLTVPASEGTLSRTYEFANLFNPDGSLAGQSFPEAGGLPAEEVSYTYDDVGRSLTTYGGFNGSTTTYVANTEYTRYGEVQRLHLGTGTKRAWISHYYEPQTRRHSRSIVDAEIPRPMQSDLNYTYNPAGTILSIADTPMDAPRDVQCFRHDYLRRLVEAWTPGNGCTADPSTGALSGPAPYWTSYEYATISNRTKDVTHAAAGDTERTYAYPAAGAPRPHGLTSVTARGSMETYEYDAAGNTTVRGTQRLTWDELGHLTGVDGTTFVTGLDGKRLLRKTPDATTLYLDGQEITLNRNTGAVSATRYYPHGGQTVSVRTSARLSWLATDHHGTAQVAIDSDTLTVSKRRHDPFGNPRGTAAATWPGEKGFVGGTTDASTGLTHLGVRDYDPTIGRFISVDPILDPGDPQQLNAYSYAANNPATFSDPSGLKYFEGDGGTWSDTPPKADPPGKPSKPAKSNAHRQDPGGRCPTGDAAHCRDVGKRAANDRKAERDDTNLQDRGDHAARAKQFDVLRRILEGLLRQLGISQRGDELYALSRVLDELSIGYFKSASVCAEASAGLVFGGTALVCFNVDNVGVTASQSLEVGFEFGADVDASILVRLNTVAADKLDIGYSTSASRSVEAGLGHHVGVGVEKHDPDKPDKQLSAFVKYGVGVGASMGRYQTPVDTDNSGYLWCWNGRSTPNC